MILCVLSARMLNSIGVLVSYVENTWRGQAFLEGGVIGPEVLVHNEPGFDCTVDGVRGRAN